MVASDMGFPGSRLAPALFLAAVLSGCGQGPGDPAPAAIGSRIAIADFTGLEEALAARRGGGFLLNFWAMWCAPCVAELPELAAVAREWRERGGALLTVSYDLMVAGAERATVEERMRSFLERRQLELEVLIYDAPDQSALDERFDLPGPIPVTLAIDAQGRVVDRLEGEGDRARFEQMMARALGRE
jgi:thiol-disulfide isomerase/thioredoxin